MYTNIGKIFEDLTLIREEVELFPAWNQKKKIIIYLDGAFAQFCPSESCSFFKVHIFSRTFLVPLHYCTSLTFPLLQGLEYYFFSIFLTYSVINSLRAGTISSILFVHVCRKSTNIHWLIDRQPQVVSMVFYLWIGSLGLWGTNL